MRCFWGDNLCFLLTPPWLMFIQLQDYCCWNSSFSLPAVLLYKKILYLFLFLCYFPFVFHVSILYRCKITGFSFYKIHGIYPNHVWNWLFGHFLGSGLRIACILLPLGYIFCARKLFLALIEMNSQKVVFHVILSHFMFVSFFSFLLNLI